MTALDLLVALCDTDAEEDKFCIRNENDSLVKLMKTGTWIGGFTLTCGKPKEGAMYLVVDALLEDCTPDLIFNHKDEPFEATMFGYIIDDFFTDEDLDL